MQTNPFVYGSPVKGKQFFNRDEELRTLFGRLGHPTHPQSTAVTGQPHIGKSSLLLRLTDPEQQAIFLGDRAPQIHIQFIDLLTIPADYKPFDFWHDALQPLHEKKEAKTEDPVVSQQLKKAHNAGYTGGSLRQLVTLLAEKGRRLVLLLDEFERLLTHSHFQNPAFFTELRFLAKHSEGLALITASRYNLAYLNAEWRKVFVTDSCFFDYMIELPLKLFDETIINHLLKQAGGIFLPTDHGFIRWRANGNPFFLQVAAHTCYQFRTKPNQIATPKADYSTIETVFQEKIGFYKKPNLVLRETDDPIKWRTLIKKLFNLGDIETLCFDLAELGIEYQNLAGDTLEDKTRELLNWFQRRTMLPYLYDYVRKQRPNTFKNPYVIEKQRGAQENLSIDEEMWELDITVRIQQGETKDGLHFEEAAIAHIIRLTKGHPDLVQALCGLLWQKAFNSQERLIVTRELIDDFVPSVLFQLANVLEDWWKSFTPIEKIYMATIAEIAVSSKIMAEAQIVDALPNNIPNVPIHHVEQVLANLIKRGVLESFSDKQYRFAVELFCYWVQQNCSLKAVEEELQRKKEFEEKCYEISLGLFDQQKWEEAKYLLQYALESSNTYFEALLLLGKTYLAQKDTESAIVQLRQAQQIDKIKACQPLVDALLQEAQQIFEQRPSYYLELAFERYQQVFELSPNNEFAQQGMDNINRKKADECVAREKFDEAIEIYKKIKEPLVKEVLIKEVLILKGDKALHLKEWDEAIKAFAEADAPDKLAIAKQQQQAALERREWKRIDGEKDRAEDFEKKQRWENAVSIYKALIEEPLIQKKPDQIVAYKKKQDHCKKQIKLAEQYVMASTSIKEKKWLIAEKVLLEIRAENSNYRDVNEKLKLAHKEAQKIRGYYLLTLVLVVVILIILGSIGIGIKNAIQAKAQATAQVSERATADIATRLNLSEDPALVYTIREKPLSLSHDTDGLIEGYSSGVHLQNFKAEALFTNPYDISQGNWSYGFMFRATDQSFFAVWLNADGRWFIQYKSPTSTDSNWAELTQGTSKNLMTGSGEQNRLTISAIGNTGSFLINGKYTSSLPLSNSQVAGDVIVATGFVGGSELEGKSTIVNDFIVWSLP